MIDSVSRTHIKTFCSWRAMEMVMETETEGLEELFALIEYGMFGAHCIDFDSTSSPWTVLGYWWCGRTNRIGVG